MVSRRGAGRHPRALSCSLADLECTESSACAVVAPPCATSLTLHYSSQLLAVPKANKPSISIRQFLKPNRPTKITAYSIHRALLVSEIFSLILHFIRQFDESPESDHKRDRTSGKRTLAALARTCRTLSDPTLDALWMRLDSLDPLIKVLPRRMWARKRYPFIVRTSMIFASSLHSHLHRSGCSWARNSG